MSCTNLSETMMNDFKKKKKVTKYDFLVTKNSMDISNVGTF